MRLFSRLSRLARDAVCLGAIVLLLLGFGAEAAESKPSAFTRVIASNTLRCGYIVYPPQLSKDPNTGALSGIAYDIVERIGKDLSLNIKWTEEVGTGSWQEGLNTGRYDMLCNTAWATTPRARIVAFSTPAFYTAVNAYARVGDTRFDKKLAVANSPDVTIATIDGGTSATIAAEDFPLAKLDSLPDLTDFSQLLLEVQTRKADLTFSEAAQFHEFERHNQGKLRNVTPDHPVRLIANAFFVAGDELRLLGMINAALNTLHNSGFIDKVLDKYEAHPNTWRRVDQPYR